MQPGKMAFLMARKKAAPRLATASEEENCVLARESEAHVPVPLEDSDEDKNFNFQQPADKGTDIAVSYHPKASASAAGKKDIRGALT